jgi:hypothetical protein
MDILHLVGRCSTFGATLTVLFDLVNLEIESHFFSNHPGPSSFYFKLPPNPWMTDMNHHIQIFSIELESRELFWP